MSKKILLVIRLNKRVYLQFGSFFMNSEEFFLEPSERECTDSLVNSTFRIWKAEFSHLQYSDVRGTKRTEFACTQEYKF